MKFIFLILFIFSNTKLFSTYYYINDPIMQGTEKWCTQPGNDTNTGKAPNLPKATITNLLKSTRLIQVMLSILIVEFTMRLLLLLIKGINLQI